MMLFKIIGHNNSDVCGCVKYMKMCFLELTVWKISDYYLKRLEVLTPNLKFPKDKCSISYIFGFSFQL